MTWCTLTPGEENSHISVCQVLKVVPSDALVSVGCENGPAIAQTTQTLHSNALPGVQQVPIKILSVTDRDIKIQHHGPDFRLCFGLLFSRFLPQHPLFKSVLSLKTTE